MRKTKKTAKRSIEKPSRPHPGLRGAHAAMISVLSAKRPDVSWWAYLPVDARFEVQWEIEKGSENLIALFAGEQLLRFAAEAGLLRQTTSSDRPLPKGIDAAVRAVMFPVNKIGKAAHFVERSLG